MNALAGLAVLVVLVQDSGGLTVDLYGPPVLLFVAGYLVTWRVSHGSWAGWLRTELGRRVPLAAVAVAAVVLLRAASPAGPLRLDGTGLTELLGLPPAFLNDLLRVPPARLSGLGQTGSATWFDLHPSMINPAGLMWLLALLALASLAWSLVVSALRRLPVTLAMVTASLTAVAGVAAAVPLAAGLPLDTRLGAGAPPTGAALLFVQLGSTLTIAPLVWLLGATVAAIRAVATGDHPERPALQAGGTAPPQAGGTAPPHAGGTGPLAELGHMAYPLLVLHLPVSYGLQLLVPGVRPAALLLVGGAVSWFAGLLLQDGLFRRLRARRPAGPAALVAACVLLVTVTTAFTEPGSPTGLVALGVGAGDTAPSAETGTHAASAGPSESTGQDAASAGNASAGGDAASPGKGVASADAAYAGRSASAGGRPVLLVVGGSEAADLAAALRAAGSGRLAVSERTGAGCGLLPTSGPSHAAVTAWRAGVPHVACPAADPAAGPVAAVLVELSDDARHPGAVCGSTARTDYRHLLADAAGEWRALAGGAPILLATPRPDVAAGSRCLTALLDELAVADREISVLDVAGLGCSDEGECTDRNASGELLRDADGRLTRAGQADLAPRLERLLPI